MKIIALGRSKYLTPATASGKVGKAEPQPETHMHFIYGMLTMAAMELMSGVGLWVLLNHKDDLRKTFTDVLVCARVIDCPCKVEEEE